jgi:hypothetical protein
MTAELTGEELRRLLELEPNATSGTLVAEVVDVHDHFVLAPVTQHGERPHAVLVQVGEAHRRHHADRLPLRQPGGVGYGAMSVALAEPAGRRRSRSPWLERPYHQRYDNDRWHDDQ